MSSENLTSDQIKQKIEVALDEIRPFLASDGGDVLLVDIVDDVVKVKFEGACVDCSVNQMTLKSGIEMTIRRHVPQISHVEEVS